MTPSDRRPNPEIASPDPDQVIATQPDAALAPVESSPPARRSRARNKPAANASAEPAVTAVPAPSTGGEDARRRGWFWHWNSLVTQYAPLIGLKGVGLLNSYTVWTDRREESPHRGYAFPSQQSEADFYGEDRAELITINKILVALDLIEIRKEMVLRTDPQGRRWRVPHNFYRVKDHPDDFTISTHDVLQVVQLAERDRAVYRYTRRLYSARFSPIDRDNPWHRILGELQLNPAWQRLSARVQAEEAKTSSRTKAGHAARKTLDTTGVTETLPTPTAGGNHAETNSANFSLAETHVHESAGLADNDSGVVDTKVADQTSVAGFNTGFTGDQTLDVAATNTGLGEDVALTNTGFGDSAVTSVGQSNRAADTLVDPTNTTYHQQRSTTTTTIDQGNSSDSITTGNGPGVPPVDAPGRAAAFRAFEEANERPPTPAERKLLGDLADRFHPAAVAVGATGWAWVGAAIYEAVGAGSRYVAPKRVKEILARWERDGEGPDDGGPRGGFRWTWQTLIPPDAPQLEIHGVGSRDAWSRTLGLLAGSIDREVMLELFTGTAIAAHRGGVVTISVSDAAQADRLQPYADMISRKLQEVVRRRVEARFTAPSGDGPTPLPSRRSATPSAATFMIDTSGLASDAVWSAVLADVEASGMVSTGEFDGWVRPTVLIGRGDEGRLLVGTPHALAKRRIDGRLLGVLEAAVQRVLGSATRLDVVVTRDWQAQVAGDIDKVAGD